MHRPYIVFIPPYPGASAGIRVLHKLVDDLNAAGEVAHVITPTSTTGQHIFHDRPDLAELIDNGAIAVYPERDFGNICGAERVVRYVLNTPIYKEGKDDYDIDELIFVYNKMLVPSVKRLKGRLYVPVIEPEFMVSQTLERELTLFYVGKGKYIDGYVDPMDYKTIEITALPPFPMSRKELAQMLRRAKVLYCFDALTAMMHEAVLCGCPVVLVPGQDELSQQRANNLHLTEMGSLGVTLIDSESSILAAALECGDAMGNYQQILKDYKDQLKHFIEVTQV